MQLVDHLRELRYRFIMAFLAIAVCTAIALIWYHELLDIVLWPIDRAVELYEAARPGAQVEMVTQGVTSAFALYFKVCFTAGFIASCPIWLYHLWRFIAPGLHKNEKRIAARFLLAAVPLFLIGVAAGYCIAPRGFSVLLSFNPPEVVNLNELNDFLTFELRLLLIFGLAFLLPVLLVTLNRIGLVSGAGLGRFRGAAIVLCALFAAIATPSTDALTMLALTVPMVAMYVGAELICRFHDRKALKDTDREAADGEPHQTERKPVISDTEVA